MSSLLTITNESVGVLWYIISIKININSSIIETIREIKNRNNTRKFFCGYRQNGLLCGHWNNQVLITSADLGFSQNKYNFIHLKQRISKLSKKRKLNYYKKVFFYSRANFLLFLMLVELRATPLVPRTSVFKDADECLNIALNHLKTYICK